MMMKLSLIKAKKKLDNLITWSRIPLRLTKNHSNSKLIGCTRGRPWVLDGEWALESFEARSSYLPWFQKTWFIYFRSFDKLFILLISSHSKDEIDLRGAPDSTTSFNLKWKMLPVSFKYLSRTETVLKIFIGAISRWMQKWSCNAIIKTNMVKIWTHHVTNEVKVYKPGFLSEMLHLVQKLV